MSLQNPQLLDNSQKMEIFKAQIDWVTNTKKVPVAPNILNILSAPGLVIP